MQKIMVVEDDIYLLKLYQEILVKENYQVEMAEDGKEALERVEDFQPDLMLLDIMLPYIDGFQVLEQLKANPDTKDIKVVILTNLDSEKQREKAMKLGAAKFMVKVGNDPGQIISGVKEVLG